MDRQEFEDGLTRKGYKLIGSGAYSNVYAKPRGRRVIKVGKMADVWPIFASQFQRFKNAPRIFSLDFYEGNENKRSFYAAKVERLFPLSKKQQSKIDNQLLSGWRLHRGRKLPAKYRSFSEALHKFNRKARASWDLGGRNTLRRRDGTIVFNDPLAGEASDESVKLASSRISKRKSTSKRAS